MIFGQLSLYRTIEVWINGTRNLSWVEIKKLFQKFLTCIYSLIYSYYTGKVNRNHYRIRFLNNSKINKYLTIISEKISHNWSSDSNSNVTLRYFTTPTIQLQNIWTQERDKFCPGKSNLRTSVGHYCDYAITGTTNW